MKFEARSQKLRYSGQVPDCCLLASSFELEVADLFSNRYRRPKVAHVFVDCAEIRDTGVERFVHSAGANVSCRRVRRKAMRVIQSKELIRRRIFLESLARCGHGAFVDRFYERFLASSPEVHEKFASTDFGRQRLMLLRSLELIAAAADGAPEGVEELRARAGTHSRSQLNIEPHLYDLWLESAIASAVEADPLWTPDVETAWRSILGAAIHHLRSQYNS